MKCTSKKAVVDAKNGNLLGGLWGDIYNGGVFFQKFRKRIIGPGSLESQCIRGIEESFSRVDSSVPLKHCDSK